MLIAAVVALAATAAVAQSSDRPQGRTLTAGVGEGLVPPREYGYSDSPIDAARQNPIEAGKIYDIAYAGIVKGKLRFEFRGYSIENLTTPDFSQTEDWPLDAGTVQVRDIAITVIEAKPDRLQYRWTYRKQDDQPVPPVDPGPASEIGNDRR